MITAIFKLIFSVFLTAMALGILFAFAIVFHLLGVQQ